MTGKVAADTYTTLVPISRFYYGVNKLVKNKTRERHAHAYKRPSGT